MQQAVPSPRIVEPLPPWLRDYRNLLKIREIPGPQHHPQIVAWLKDCGLPPEMLADETAWCAAGTGGVLKAAGLKGTGRANARSYLTWGTALATPRLGCVSVYERPPNPAQGHVTFWISDFGPDQHLCFGANQQNAFSFALYPTNLHLGWRWPAGVP